MLLAFNVVTGGQHVLGILPSLLLAHIYAHFLLSGGSIIIGAKGGIQDKALQRMSFFFPAVLLDFNTPFSHMSSRLEPRR
jgi:hypothetical protein